MQLSKFFITSSLLFLPAIAVDRVSSSYADSARDLFEFKPEDPKPNENAASQDQPREYVRGRSLAYHRYSSHESSRSKKIQAPAPKPVPPPVSKPVHPPVSSKSIPPPVSSKSAPKPVSPPAGKGGKGYWPPPGKGKGYVTPPGKGKGAVPPPGKGKGAVPPPGNGKGKGAVPPPGKGKGWVPPPGKGKGKGYVAPQEPVCSSFGIIFRTQDLVPRQTPGGRTFDNVPFYDGEGEAIIGFYNEHLVNLASEDCMGTGTFSFGRNFTSQLFVQFTCDGAYTAVVGGTGDYGCAEGYLEYGLQTQVQVNALITICSSLCPASGSTPRNATRVPSMPAPTMPAPNTPPRPVMTPTALPVKATMAPSRPNPPKH